MIAKAHFHKSLWSPQFMIAKESPVDNVEKNETGRKEPPENKFWKDILTRYLKSK